MRKTPEFTPQEIKTIYSIVEKFGGDKKPQLKKALMSLLQLDRRVMKRRLNSVYNNLMIWE